MGNELSAAGAALSLRKRGVEDSVQKESVEGGGCCTATQNK